MTWINPDGSIPPCTCQHGACVQHPPPPTREQIEDPDGSDRD